MKKIILIILILSINAYASECYVIGDDFVIKKDYSDNKKSDKGNLKDCENWKVVEGVVNIISPSGNHERGAGAYLVDKKSHSYFSNFVAFVTGESDKAHEGVQQFGDGIELFYMPNKGYLLPTDRLELSLGQFFYIGNERKKFLIKEFEIYNNAISLIKDDKVVITNLKQGKAYDWAAYDDTNERSIGNFIVVDQADKKDFEDALKAGLKDLDSNKKIAIDLLKARVMYDWELFYDSRKLITNHVWKIDL